MKLKHYIVVFLASIALLGTANDFQKSQVQADEYALKASFLYRFIDYIAWDISNEEPVNIAVLGDSEMYVNLLKISQNIKPGSRVIRVRRVENLDELGSNQVIFIPRNYKVQVEAIAETLAEKPALIISEQRGDLEKGSHINFVFSDNKLKFEINLRAATKSGIKIGSQLLQHAAVIKK